MIRLFFTLVFALSLTFVHAASMDERISIPTKINGKPVKFIFDTGAASSCMLWGYDVAAELGVKVVPPPPDTALNPGEIAVGKTELVTFELLGVTLRDRLDVWDAPLGLRHGGFQGLIGWSKLSDNLIGFNARDKKIQIIKNLPDDILLWKKVKIRKEKEVLVLEFTAANGSSDAPLLMIDTGNPAGVALAPEAWRKWRAEHADQAITLSAFSMPGVGVRVHEEAWAEELALGGVILRGVPVREANFLEMRFAADGSLGLAALRQFNLITDNVKSYAHIQVRAEKPLPYDHNRLGAVFIPPNPTSNELVATVATGSPAALAGIVNGDVLLKVDALDVTPWRTKPGILPLARFWNGPAGASLALTLKRGDQTLTFTVTLKDIIGPKSTKT